jgi:hypothetical protein
MRTPAQAIEAARGDSRNDVGMCLHVVQNWFGSPHGYPDAISQWEASTRKHPGDRTPPVGVPVFYGPGSGGRHGHIALFVGGARIRSTDCPSAGIVGETDLDWPTRKWGHPYLGWTGDLGGVAIPGVGGAAPAPQSWADGDVYLSHLHAGQADSDSVRRLQHALNAHHLAPPGDATLPITGTFGPETATVVVACQQQHGFGHDPLPSANVGAHQAAHLFGVPPYAIHP